MPSYTITQLYKIASYVCVYVCKGQGATLGIILRTLTKFFETCLLLAWSLAIGID